MIKRPCVLFDLDGTLLDTAPDFVYALQLLRTEMGLNELTSSQLASIRNAVPHGGLAIVQAGFGADLALLDQSHIITRFLEIYLAGMGYYSYFFPGIEALLHTLEAHHIPWAVVTNKEHRFTKPLLQRLALWDRAACVVSGDTTEYQKPHPEPLLYACRYIDILPQDCVYIGDAKGDIDAGKKAGMKTICALFGYVSDQSATKSWEADYYANHANEILPWIEQWIGSRKIN
jgi:N-acetyl-D-muramate 6-phosphate phosphatase